jgi:hypothetical protein
MYKVFYDIRGGNVLPFSGNADEEVITVRLQVGEHIVEIEGDENIRVTLSIFGFAEFLCVFIGRLEFVTCCLG